MRGTISHLMAALPSRICWSALLIAMLGLAISEPAISASLTANADTPPTCSDHHMGAAGPLMAVCGDFMAFATYGVLQASATAPSGAPIGANGFATADFQDEIVLSGLTSTATLHVMFFESHLGNVGLDQVLEFVNGAQCVMQPCITTVTPGVPITIQGHAVTSAAAGTQQSNGAALTLAEIELVNSAGQPISGATYTTDSGRPYNFPGASFVPEPEPLALVAIPLLALPLMLFRRQRTQT